LVDAVVRGQRSLGDSALMRAVENDPEPANHAAELLQAMRDLEG
jgi:hypothetical protein